MYKISLAYIIVKFN